MKVIDGQIGCVWHTFVMLESWMKRPKREAAKGRFTEVGN